MNFDGIINKIRKVINKEQGENIIITTKLKFSEREILNRIKDAVQSIRIEVGLSYAEHNKALGLDRFILDALDVVLNELEEN